MKNNILRIFFFLTIVIVIPLVWFSLKASGGETYDRLQFDLGENRNPVTIDDPSKLLTSGTLLTDFFSDRAPFRSLVIKINRKVSSKIEKPYEDGIKPFAMKLYNRSEQNKTDITTVEKADNKVDDKEAFSELFGQEDYQADIDTPDGTPEEGAPDEEGKGLHDYEQYYYYEATCIEDGLAKYRCKDCGAEYKEVTRRTNHELKELYEVEPAYEYYGFTAYICEKCGQLVKQNITDKPIDDSYLAPTIKQSEVIVGRSGWLFLAGDGNLAYYTRENVLSEDSMKEYADSLQEVNDLCNDLGIQFAVMIAPNKDQVYSEYMPSFSFASNEKRVVKMVDYIKRNTDVSITYSYSELSYAKRYWQTYYMFDSHWNKMGAFIGEQALIKQLGRQVTSPFMVRNSQHDIYKVGDLILLGGLEDSDYPKDTDFEVDYKPKVTSESLIEGNWDVMTFYQTASDADNDDKLVLVGDSYRINMIPYLAKDFSMCSYVYKNNIEEATEALKDADILVIECVERLDFTIPESARALAEILKQQKENNENSD